jgi:hypothetical protein
MVQPDNWHPGQQRQFHSLHYRVISRGEGSAPGEFRIKRKMGRMESLENA